MRARAVDAGLVTPAIAEAADDDTLLSLLFLPGFSTRESSDLLAGRGIGLDIARSGVQRMGGAIRLSSRAGEGFSARIDVPIESGLVTVLWVIAGKEEFALPAANVRRVRLNDGADAARLPHLLSCLDGAPCDPGALRHRPRAAGGHAARAWPRSASTPSGTPRSSSCGRSGRSSPALGPFAGAIVRGDGSLRLALDAWAIAPRARAFSAAAVSSGSPPPSRH